MAVTVCEYAADLGKQTRYGNYLWNLQISQLELVSVQVGKLNFHQVHGRKIWFANETETIGVSWRSGIPVCGLIGIVSATPNWIKIDLSIDRVEAAFTEPGNMAVS